MYVYILVLVGSFVGICTALLLRVVLKQRSMRRFVRSIQKRWHSAEEREQIRNEEEQQVKQFTKDPRTSAIELQQVRTLLRNSEKAQKQDNMQEAEKLLIQALTIQPTSVDVRAELAKLYLTVDRPSKAEAMYKDLVQDRNDASLHANLGLAYYRQEKFVEACDAYHSALTLDPKNPDRSAALGRACIAATQYEGAIPHLEKAATYQPKNTELLHLVAECYLQLGKQAQAIESYERILNTEPYNEDVQQKINALRTQEQGDIEPTHIDDRVAVAQ